MQSNHRVIGVRYVSSDRLLAIYEMIARRERDRGAHGLLCSVAAQFTELGGAGVVLTSPQEPLTSFCMSNPTSASLMDFEVIAGEGPYTAANNSEVAVEGSDLMMQNPRWTVFSPMATAIGVHAVFGFPIHFGTIRLGALGLFRDSVGDLSEDQYADAYLVTSVIGRSILALQAGTDPGRLSEDLQRGALFDFAVHQAVGMVSVQGSMPTRDALVALQSHAFAQEMGISDISAQIISRQICFAPESGTWTEEIG